MPSIVAVDSPALRGRKYQVWQFLVCGCAAFIFFYDAVARTGPYLSGQAQSAETCVVSGFVLRQSDNLPLQGATVEIASVDEGSSPISVRSGPDGHFELTNITAGRYRVTASRDGYVDRDYGQKMAEFPGPVITLLPTQHLENVVIALPPKGFISGRVYDNEGTPLQKATLTADREIYVAGHKEFVTAQTATSTDSGEYRLRGLLPGRYIVSAHAQKGSRVSQTRRKPDHKQREEVLVRTYFPNEVVALNASVVFVGEGEERSGINVVIQRAIVYRIRGKIVDKTTSEAGGTPQLTLVRRDVPLAVEFISGHITSNIAKAFEFTNILPGPYTLRAQLDDRGKVYSAQQDVDITDANVDGVRLVMHQGTDVPGNIKWEGAVHPPDREITISASPIYFGGAWGIYAHTEDNGDFTLHGMPEGMFHLMVSGIPTDSYVKELRQGVSVTQELEFRVVRGASNTLEVMIGTHGARIIGVVENDNDLPEPGVVVVAVPRDLKNRVHRLYKFGVTDQVGRFELRGLAPGEYNLFSWDNVERGAWEDADFIKPFEYDGVAITVLGQEVKDVKLSVIRRERGSDLSSRLTRRFPLL